jgi:glycosyltransferase involved in cell wall biosynthesis
MIRVTYMVDARFLGGAEWYVSRLATHLDRAHFTPSVMLRTPDHDGGLDAWASHLEQAGVPVSLVPMNLPFRPLQTPAILRALQAHAPQVVHVNMPGPYDGQMGLLVPLARLTGARAVVTEHLPMVRYLWKRAAVKRLAFRFLDAAVTMSHANARLLQSRQRVPARRIHVVYNGVPARAANDMRRSPARQRFGVGDEVLVVFAGNLIEHKGLRDTIEALAQVQVPAPWRLLVAGDGPDRVPCEQRAAAAGVADRVRFLGRLDPDAMQAVFDAGDLLALPSRHEGMPYVILEAMAAGMPVVSTGVYGIPEAVVDGETGVLVSPGDIAALRDALARLIGDAALRQRMGRAARARHAESFTLDAQVAAMSELYRSLVRGA